MTKKVLYISGGGGLGHVARDLTIARELRKLKPDYEIIWLAEEPATSVLKEAGEKVVGNLWRANIEMNLQANDKNEWNVGRFFLYYTKFAQEDIINNQAIIEKEKPDIIVGDEAYNQFFAFTGNPALAKQPFVYLSDFTKSGPMTFNPKERIGIWVLNRMWLQKSIKGWNQIPSAANIFFFPEEDVPDERLGLFLMNTREALGKFKNTYYVGYPAQFDPADYKNTAAIKKRLGYGNEPLIICAVGGSSVGKAVLNLCGRAYPLIKAQMPDVKMVMVAGPSIDPKSLNMPEGIDVRGYVPNLFEHYAASDLAIVLGGGTSTLELAALKRPFIYLPLEKHFEQQHIVALRNERYHAGIMMRFPETTPEMLAQAVVSNIGKKVEYLDMPIDGCKKAAEIIAKLM
ncbi:MAG: glycosyltransferase [Candidatus Methanomethylicaceae archaeon]|jgi:UDP-N-acetylglucosamine:LPS N-acetylglucosamine transferase